jgi:predicted amidohydrolase YtcJ
MTKLTLLVKGARIFTLNDSQPWAQAVGVIDDRIVYVGTDTDVAGMVGPETKVIDAGGRLVLPGLIDAHTHCINAYQTYFWANLTNVDSFKALVTTLKKHASEHPEHRLVGGSGFRYSAIMVDGRLPGRSQLDRIFSDKPLWIVSYDGWTACANTKFLEIARNKLGEGFVKIQGVEFDPETQEPTGIFYKTEEIDPVVEEISVAGNDIVYDGLKLVIDDMIRWGITSVHDVGVASLSGLQIYERLRRNGELKARVYVAMLHDRTQGDEQFADFEKARSQYSDEWIRAGAVKLFIDGVEDSHTAAMLEPYDDSPDMTGETIYHPTEFKQLVQKLDNLGFQCITHSCGDRGVRVVLDAYENALVKNPPMKRRHRIEHDEIVSPEDIPRFQKLAVIPSMQPLHADLSSPDFDDVYGKTIGPERLERSFPWRSMVVSGAKLAFSSDWPVADMNPFLGIHTAVTRGRLVGTQNTISLEEAIKCYTINAAYASFEEELKGSIEVGKLADFVVLSHDLFKIHTHKIKDVEPVLTIVGGREVYRSKKYPG